MYSFRAGVIDLIAWTDMETFQRIPRNIEEKRNKKAKEIRQAYLNTRYFFGRDSPATKDAQALVRILRRFCFSA